MKTCRIRVYRVYAGYPLAAKYNRIVEKQTDEKRENVTDNCIAYGKFLKCRSPNWTPNMYTRSNTQ